MDGEKLDIKTVGIISKPHASQAGALMPELIGWLEARGLAVCYDEVTAEYLGRDDGLPREQVPDRCQLIVVLGGDGTLLSAARAVGPRETPLFPVNLGGLGFLTAIPLKSLYPELERMLEGKYRMARRKLLHCALVRGEDKIGEYEALNDVVVTKAALARMTDLEALVDGNLVCRYKADGLIVSTPTGSTAYSLAAGGPIIFPSVEALSITPICPHMLTNRPVILPDTSIIEIVNYGEDDSVYLTIDGQIGGPLRCGDRIRCRSSRYSICLTPPPRMAFFDVLREKLNWGAR